MNWAVDHPVREVIERLLRDRPPVRAPHGLKDACLRISELPHEGFAAAGDRSWRQHAAGAPTTLRSSDPAPPKPWLRRAEGRAPSLRSTRPLGRALAWGAVAAIAIAAVALIKMGGGPEATWQTKAAPLPVIAAPAGGVAPPASAALPRRSVEPSARGSAPLARRAAGTGAPPSSLTVAPERAVPSTGPRTTRPRRHLAAGHARRGPGPAVAAAEIIQPQIEGPLGSLGTPALEVQGGQRATIWLSLPDDDSETLRATVEAAMGDIQAVAQAARQIGETSTAAAGILLAYFFGEYPSSVEGELPSGLTVEGPAAGRDIETRPEASPAGEQEQPVPDTLPAETGREEPAIPGAQDTSAVPAPAGGGLPPAATATAPPGGIPPAPETGDPAKGHCITDVGGGKPDC